MPGYGFSDAPKLPGHGIAKNGEIMSELMTIIGYNEYGNDRNKYYLFIFPSYFFYAFHSPSAKIIDTFLQFTIVTHGSDWGSMIGKWVAINRPTHCKAYHTVMPMCFPVLPTPKNLLAHPLIVLKFLESIPLGFDTVYGQDHVRLKGKSFADVVNDREAGYRAIQGTRPYTLAYGLTDSPVGLLCK